MISATKKTTIGLGVTGAALATLIAVGGVIPAIAASATPTTDRGVQTSAWNGHNTNRPYHSAPSTPWHGR